MNRDDRLERAVHALAAGDAVDWEAAESAAGDPIDAATFHQLRIVAGIATFHRKGALAAPRSSGATQPGPDQWGSLRLIRQIGRGAFGDVYEAYDPQLERTVALKLLQGTEPSADRTSEAIQEGTLLARVRHPHVVTVFGASRIDGRTGIWMEFIHGRTLAEFIASQGVMSASQAASVGRDVCRGLSAVHDAGVVHRDIKAQNVMREDGGRVILMDFGAGFDHQGSAGQPFAGTPAYLAPEVLRGEPATPQSDVYSVGVLLYFLLTASFPVRGQSIAEIRTAHETGKTVALRQIRPKVPRAFVSIVERALDANPADRFVTAAAMADALDQFATRTRRWARRAVAAATVVVATAVSVSVIRRTHPASAASGPPAVVLIGAFENHTGQEAFDRAVARAIEHEIALSPRLRVALSDRVGGTLSLMKRPLNAELTRTIAREIAIRDGAIAWIVVGSVDPASHGDVATAQIVDPRTNDVVAGFQEATGGASDLPDAGRRLGQEIRTLLETHAAPPEAPDRSMQQVTTASFDAWQDYVVALDAMKRHDYTSTTELTRKAIERDPTFASAHIWLAWSLRNTNRGRTNEAVLDEIARAVALADDTSGPERCWILGSASDMRDDPVNATAEYEALLAIQPDHFWGLSNLAQKYRNDGRLALAAKLRMRLADFYPTDFRANADAVQGLLLIWEDVDRIASIAARANSLMTPELAHSLPGQATVVLLAPPNLAWGRRDARAASAALKDALADRRGAEDPVATNVIVHAENLYLSMGQTREARAILERLNSDGEREIYRAQLDYFVGDAASAVNHARSAADSLKPPDEQPFLNSMLLRLGLVDKAQMLLTQLDPKNIFNIAARGELAAAQHNDDLAIEILTPSLLGKLFTGEYFRAVRALSDAWLHKGDRQRAIDVLRSAVTRPYDNTANGGSTLEGTAVRFRLAALYRHAGNSEEAASIEAEARRGLDQADPRFLNNLRALAEVGLTR